MAQGPIDANQTAVLQKGYTDVVPISRADSQVRVYSTRSTISEAR